MCARISYAQFINFEFDERKKKEMISTVSIRIRTAFDEKKKTVRKAYEKIKLTTFDEI